VEASGRLSGSASAPDVAMQHQEAEDI
jgi:hypothetical protein